MKRFTLLTLCLGMMLSLSPRVTSAAEGQPAAGQKKSVGLIDMAYLFKEYKKFADLRDQLRNDIKGSDDKAKQMGEQLQALQKTLKDGTYKEGTPEYQKIEAQLIAQSTQFEAFRKTQQREYLRRESKIYKDIYMEVVEAVGQYASYYQYDVIIRFSRDGVGETDNAQELIQNMNRQVVWHNQGIDITEAVLKYLNSKYTPTAAAPAGDTTTK
ncbi:OmpH family outer membrane protein [Rubinisphaera margarita]|uniref:OmpH family outer membrane protein n=1 Tax=Rubinisphaera margarita TaxID=2909586 RepID=UPI001EE9492B|nr:OmpH family outer membrane protein [Rubinisphaera margarita]MCG6157574.1 OmpH family outer membrane protein [Rubinisphaera margarita]